MIRRSIQGQNLAEVSCARKKHNVPFAKAIPVWGLTATTLIAGDSGRKMSGASVLKFCFDSEKLCRQ
jgi:hypothetical protein